MISSADTRRIGPFMNIVIAADHNGVGLKAHLVEWLHAAGHEVEDRGPHGDAIVDYPPLCEELAGRVLAGHAERGIFVGGTGSGESIAFNKLSGIRAALAQGRLTTEISRAHNDTNVLVLGAKVLSEQEAVELTDVWLRTPFKGGRHARRLKQIAALEAGESLL
jgi:ribose 5-phosphate isomerase B